MQAGDVEGKLKLMAAAARPLAFISGCVNRRATRAAVDRRSVTSEAHGLQIAQVFQHEM